MKFTTQPQNLSPVDAGLVYAFDTESDEPRDVQVSVIEYDSYETVGRLTLYGVTDGSFDIAPYVRPFMEMRPTMERGTALAEAPCYQFVVEIDGVRSRILTVSDNRVDVVAGSWLSTMTEHRRICHGGRDEIRLFCRPGETLDASVVSDDGMTMNSILEPENGAAVLRIDTRDFPEDAKTLEVRVVCSSRFVRSVYYSFAKRYPDDMRLVWLSSVGTVERYTFPIVRSIERNTTRTAVVGADGSRRTVGCESEQCIRIVSDFERRGVIEALTDIARSPKVWVEGALTFTEVEVLTTASTLYEYGRPCFIEIDLRIAGGKEAGL